MIDSKFFILLDCFLKALLKFCVILPNFFNRSVVGSWHFLSHLESNISLILCLVVSGLIKIISKVCSEPTSSSFANLSRSLVSSITMTLIKNLSRRDLSSFLISFVLKYFHQKQMYDLTDHRVLHCILKVSNLEPILNILDCLTLLAPSWPACGTSQTVLEITHFAILLNSCRSTLQKMANNALELSLASHSSSLVHCTLGLATRPSLVSIIGDSYPVRIECQASSSMDLM